MSAEEHMHVKIDSQINEDFERIGSEQVLRDASSEFTFAM